nr:hypothetical protein [Tanacetum cinerariifolium]
MMKSRVKMKLTQEMRHLLAAALQSGQLKKPDHADLQNKCMIYARLLQLLKIKSSPTPWRKFYCSFINQLLSICKSSH